MKRIATLVSVVALVSAFAPQALQAANGFVAPDGEVVQVTTACNYFYGVEVTPITTSGHFVTHRLWVLPYANNAYGRWTLLYDWTRITGTNSYYKPLSYVPNRQVQLYVEIAILTQNGWQYQSRILRYDNYSSEWGRDVYWCYA